MTHTARLHITFSSPILHAVQGALRPEALVGAEAPKTRARLSVEGDALVIDVEADDMASLRAVVNSYLRWVDAAERAADAGRG